MEENNKIEPEQPSQNIPEVEHSEIPPSSGKIIPSQENILPVAKTTPTELQQTINPQPTNPEKMEVHHHGHIHENKKWKEYLFEFLMIFLAVTLGFFVEN
jgi:hypothetical protein